MKMSWTFTIILFLLFISSSHSHTRGTATVDIVTFERILEKFDTVLVKFDGKYPFGDKHEHFKRFVESASDKKELLLLEVPVTDTDDKENEELVKKYKIDTKDFPVYKLFLKDKSKPLDYPGSADKTEDDLRRFLTRYTNIWVGLPGTIENLDYLARDFFDATSNHDRKGQKVLFKRALEEAKNITEEKDQKNKEAYLKIMETLIEQGIDYLSRERRRMQNLLQGKVTPEKRIELQHRFNILLSFKSAKDSIMYHMNNVQDIPFGNTQNIKVPPNGRKDL